MTSDLRVLLLAPLPDIDPAPGDVAYTQSLLQEPPPGVRYTTYVEALAEGTLVMRGRRPRHGHWRLRDGGLLALRAFERGARGRLMFSEPFWFADVDGGAISISFASASLARACPSSRPPDCRCQSCTARPAVGAPRERRWRRRSIASTAVRCGHMPPACGRPPATG